MAPQDRLEFETLISDTSAALIQASPNDPRPAIEVAVERVRQFFDAGRCALLAVNEDRRFVHVHTAAYAAGVSHVSGDVNLADLFPWTYRQLVTEAVPVLTRPAELPPEAAMDRASNEALGIRSALAVPMATAGHVTHLIVLNAVTEERDWPVGSLATRSRTRLGGLCPRGPGRGVPRPVGASPECWG